MASPIDDKSSVLSSSSSTPDISTLPLKKDNPANSNSTNNSGVLAHPLHKRDVNGPPKVADQSSGVNSQTSSTPSSAQNQQNSQSSGSNPSQSRVNRQVQKIGDSTSGVTQSSLKLQTVPTPSSANANSNYNPQSLYNQQRKPANVPNSQPIQPASSNPSASLQLGQASNQPILSQNSRVRRDAPQLPSTAQKSQVAPKPSANQKQGQTLAQQPPKVQTPSRKTRDAPQTADPKAVPSLNQKAQVQPQVNGQKSNKPVEPGQFAITNSRPVRDAPNPVEQSKIVPSAYQPAQSNGNSKSSDAVTASPPLVAKVPQQKRESVPLSSSSVNQSPQFVHPVPVEQILKKPSIDSSSGS